jgi:hypothetical protein
MTVGHRDDPGDSWYKSSRSSSGGCLEVCRRPAEVLVRDSKDPGGAVLTFDAAVFDEFVRAVKRGEFDLPGTPAPPLSG